MGRSAALQLAGKGAHVIIVARRVEKLQGMIPQLQVGILPAHICRSRSLLTVLLGDLKAAAKSPSQRFHYISADVSLPNYSRAVLEEAKAWNQGQPLDIVWLVAGVATPKLWSEPDALTANRHNMDVNYWGAADLSHNLLQEWWSPDAAPHPDTPRHLIFTGSIAIFYSMVGYTPYTPAKCALRALVDALSQEALLFPQTPVRIALAIPGGILSPGFDNENKTKSEVTKYLEKDDVAEEPDHVAQKCIAGLERGEYMVNVSPLGHLLRTAMLGGSYKNNTVLDFFRGLLAMVVWLFTVPIHRKEIIAFGKRNGHPSTWGNKA